MRVPLRVSKADECKPAYPALSLNQIFDLAHCEFEFHTLTEFDTPFLQGSGLESITNR